MLQRQLIKKNAKRALAGFWAQAVAITLLLTGFFLLISILETLLMELLHIPNYIDVADTPHNPFDDIPNTSPLAFAILLGGWALSFLVGTPIRYGAWRWFYLRGGAVEVSFGDVFFYFASVGQYAKCLWMQLNLQVRRLFYGCLFLLPGLGCIAAGIYAQRVSPPGSESMLATGLTVSGYVVLGCGALLYLIFRQRYTLARYMLFQRPVISTGEAIKLSIRGSRRNRLAMACFLPTFLLWYIACAFGIPILYVYPYMSMARGIYARVLITGHNLPEHLDAMRGNYEKHRRERREEDDRHLRGDSPV